MAVKKNSNNIVNNNVSISTGAFVASATPTVVGDPLLARIASQGFGAASIPLEAVHVVIVWDDLFSTTGAKVGVYEQEIRGYKVVRMSKEQATKVYKSNALDFALAGRGLEVYNAKGDRLMSNAEDVAIYHMSGAIKPVKQIEAAPADKKATPVKPVVAAPADKKATPNIPASAAPAPFVEDKKDLNRLFWLSKKVDGQKKLVTMATFDTFDEAMNHGKKIFPLMNSKGIQMWVVDVDAKKRYAVSK
jgi:hypothetical protein